MSEDHHQEINPETVYKLPLQEVRLSDFPVDDGYILDIGAGGEGIIPLLKGRQVIGIDRRKEELSETENLSLKIVMDATDLKFLDDTFSLATAFFTFMYMPWDDIEMCLRETKRVLKAGGRIMIWDALVEAPDNPQIKYFMIPLRVILPNGRIIETGYGAKVRNQQMDDFLTIAKKLDFSVIEKNRHDHFFEIELAT